MLSREEFLQDTDHRRETAHIDGLGTVLMRELSVGERLDLRKRCATMDVDEDERELVTSLAYVAVSLCTDGGAPMFGLDGLGDGIEALRGKSERTVMALQEVFLRVCGMDTEAVERAVGNSMEIPSDSSCSDSLGISDTQQSAA